MGEFTALLPLRKTKPPSSLPLISVGEFSALLHITNDITRLRITVVWDNFVSIVLAIERFLYMLKLRVELCIPFSSIQVCNFGYLLGVSPITLHIIMK